jgi:aspartyl protease family protein
MRNFVFFAFVILAVALIAPRFLNSKIAPASEPAAAKTLTTPASASRPQTSASGGTFTVRRDGRGHFKVEARVDGRRMDFMVDTGATVIAIPEREAARLGIHPARREYTAQMNTANGTILAAPVQLAMVEVGNITVRNVRAVVMPDAALSENLLGMSFLSRLRKFEMADGRLLLEQ